MFTRLLLGSALALVALLPEPAEASGYGAQQVVVLQQMVRDLNLPLEIVPWPTVREEDGLAMSSRNRRLTAEDRKEAAALYAYAAATRRTVVCLAHVTNTMAVDGDDFEKGTAGGAVAALQVVRAVANTLSTSGSTAGRRGSG